MGGGGLGKVGVYYLSHKICRGLDGLTSAGYYLSIHLPAKIAAGWGAVGYLSMPKRPPRTKNVDFLAYFRQISPHFAELCLLCCVTICALLMHICLFHSVFAHVVTNFPYMQIWPTSPQPPPNPQPAGWPAGWRVAIYLYEGPKNGLSYLCNPRALQKLPHHCTV